MKEWAILNEKSSFELLREDRYEFGQTNMSSFQHFVKGFPVLSLRIKIIFSWFWALAEERFTFNLVRKNTFTHFYNKKEGRCCKNNKF